MKKITSLCIAFILMALTLGTVPARAATYGDLTYTVSNGEVTITGCAETATEVTIPDTIEGYPVTKIGEKAFSNCRNLTSITISKNIVEIGNFAFQYCAGLTEVNIENLAAWCEIDFLGYTANPVVYSQKLYINGNLVTQLVIPDGVTEIGNYAFTECIDIIGITIPDGVTIIGKYAFSGCDSLTKVIGGDDVTSIGECAFGDCVNLTSIDISENTETIGNGAFIDCSGLTSVTIPDSVTSIGYSAFHGCEKLTTVHYAGTESEWNAITIGNYNDALLNAEIIFPIDISDLTYEIVDGEVTITDCFDSVFEVTVPEKIEGYPVTKIGKNAFSGCSLLERIVLPDTLTEIGEGAFQWCASLSEIHIPEGVTSIGERAFSSCEYLLEITIPENVTEIKAFTFSSCYFLCDVILPDGVTAIGDGAFFGCRSIHNIHIPDAVTKIGKQAFYACEVLEEVTGCTNVAEMGQYVFSGCAALKSFTIPEKVNIIGFGMFEECSSLRSVTIHEGVTEIGGAAFAGCSVLVNIDIPESVTKIGGSAFSHCERLRSVIIPEGVTTIESWMFSDCYGLESVTIPVSVTKIEDNIFYHGCPGTIYYLGTKSQWNCIDIAEDNEDLFLGNIVWKEDPVLYKINSITLKNNKGEEITEIPNGSFLATVSFTNVAATESTVIILAQYTKEGAFKNVIYVQTEDVPQGSTMKYTVPINNQAGDIATLKAFCWESFASMTPVGNMAIYPANEQ